MAVRKPLTLVAGRTKELPSGDTLSPADIGATAVGAALVTLSDPSALVWLRVNADNTVTARTASETRTDLGVGGLSTANTWSLAQTFSAAWTVSTGSSSALPAVSANAGTARRIKYQTAGSDRWQAGADGVAESGSNVGSDYVVTRYSDAGALLATAMHIARATGSTAFAGGINNTAIGASTPSTVACTTLSATTTLASGSYTVATLPTGASGLRAFVTDASAPTWGATVVGGGAVDCPVHHDGSAWKVG